MKHINFNKIDFNINRLALGMFAIVSSIMLLVCYEWVIKDQNITSFMTSKFIPVVYSICIVLLNYYVISKSFYKKDTDK